MTREYGFKHDVVDRGEDLRCGFGDDLAFVGDFLEVDLGSRQS